MIFAAGLDGDAIEERAADAELRMGFCQAFYIEQTNGGHHVPGAELALVFILAVAIAVDAFGAVELVADGPDPFLCERGFAGEIKKPGYMQVGLVAVVVDTADTRKRIDGSAAAE